MHQLVLLAGLRLPDVWTDRVCTLTSYYKQDNLLGTMPHKYNLRKRRKIVYYTPQNRRINRAAFLFFTKYIRRFNALQVIHVVDAETQTVRALIKGHRPFFQVFHLWVRFN